MNSSNSILDESFVDETQLNANQPAIVRRCFDETTSDEVMEVREESRNEQQRPDNKEILDALEVITLRLATIETNQVVLQKNQEIISRQVEELVEKMINKSEMLAENKILRECKVTLQKIELSIGRMTGEVRDQILDEVASSFPINSITSVSDIEDKIMNSPEYAQAMITYFHKLKGASEDVSTVLKYIFTDELLMNFNWDGRWEKQALCKLKLVEICLRDVFKTQAPYDFQKAVKRSIER